MREKIDNLLCAVVCTASHQHVLEACTVCGDPTMWSGMHRKPSTCVRSMYCVERYAQQAISMCYKHLLCVERLLCAAICTASHQHVLEACTVCGDPTVCSCRHSKPSACVRSMYCLWRPYCVQLYAQQAISMC